MYTLTMGYKKYTSKKLTFKTSNMDTKTILEVCKMISCRMLVLEEAKEYSEEASGAYNEFIGLYDALQMLIKDDVTNL